jgi:AbrB family looped-hinge helix DNA binding protein
MKESIYRMRVQKLRRVTIPKPIYEALELSQGDTVEIKIKKVK